MNETTMNRLIGKAITDTHLLVTSFLFEKVDTFVESVASTGAGLGGSSGISRHAHAALLRGRLAGRVHGGVVLECGHVGG